MFFGNKKAPAGDEHQLIRSAIAGEDGAVELLVRRLMPVIRARARLALARERRAGDGALESGDLAQEVWLRLIEDHGRRLLTFDPQRSMSLEGYVGLVAEREMGNLLREATARKRGGHLQAVAMEHAQEAAGPDATPEEQASALDLAARLAEHLHALLPARGRLVFRYAFTDELPPTEVARILGVTVQVVYNWQHRIRDAARAFLAAR